jgi:RNA polymerase-binding protein DksA
MMKKTDAESYRRHLLKLRARCNKDVAQLTDEALRPDEGGNLSHTPIHMADLGSENFEQDFTLGLLEDEEKMLGEIDRALSRLESNSFGRCEECGTEIPRERLLEIPYTRHCIDCARKLEERA